MGAYPEAYKRGYYGHLSGLLSAKHELSPTPVTFSLPSTHPNPERPESRVSRAPHTPPDVREIFSREGGGLSRAA